MDQNGEDVKKLLDVMDELRPTLNLLKEMQDSGLTETLSYLVSNFDRIFNYTTKMEFYDLLTALKKLSVLLQPISAMSDEDIESVAKMLGPLPSAIKEAKSRSESAKPVKTMDLIRILRSDDMAFLIFLAMAVSERMRK
ncbi:hypothetical protein [Thermoplasma acidophilum]|nr:hypothetical protein [Thermoplasma acidophilum]MCY0851325.1 hypothetical protein [Thermoplasma acidophilum]